MNYIEEIVARLRELIPDCEDTLLRLYALLVLTTGETTGLCDIHDAWAVWRSVTCPEHENLVPFDELTPEVQLQDFSYRDAIRRVARGGE